MPGSLQRRDCRLACPGRRTRVLLEAWFRGFGNSWVRLNSNRQVALPWPLAGAAVDDDAGVENLVGLLARLLAAEDSAQSRQVQQVAFIGSDDQADVRHQEHDEDLQEALGVSLGNAAADDQGEEVGATDAEEASDGGADQPFEADGAQLPFEHNDSRTDQCAHARVNIAGLPERLNDEAGSRYNDDKKKTYKNEIHGKPPRGCSLPICPYD